MSSLYVDTELVHRACSRAHWVSRDSSQYFTSFWDQGPWVYVCFVSGHVRQEALSSQNTINVLDMRRGEGKPQSLCSVTLVSGRTGQKTTVSESNCSSMFSSSALMCFFFFFFHCDSTLISRTSPQAGMMGWHSVLLYILSFLKLLIIISLIQLTASRTLSWLSPWLSEYCLKSLWSACSSNLMKLDSSEEFNHSFCRSYIINLSVLC